MQPPKNIEALFAALRSPNVVAPAVPPVVNKPAFVKPKYIQTPEILWQLFIDYKALIKANPIVKVEQKKGSVILPKSVDYNLEIKDTVEMPLQRPLTMDGFYNFLDHKGIITDATDYFENKEGRYAEYVRICTRIRRTIRQDQIEGGMAGVYNASITQRLNNLVEKTQDIKTEQPLFPD